MDITELLAFSLKNGASDLHLSAGLPPMIRVDGDIIRLDRPALTDADVRLMIQSVMNNKLRDTYSKGLFLEADFSFSVPDVARFRANVFTQDRGAAAALRVIPSRVQSLSDLKAPRFFEDIASKPRGLVLVTGPTGSGKSTTLAAMINHINVTQSVHILTIEDPIEALHVCQKSIINQREVGRDTQSFEEALRSALREDPDVIMVGEMRDLETIRLALSAAETGHLVLATLHTNSAAKSIDRMIDVFPSNEKDTIRTMMSESLQAVISQTLMKKIGGGRIVAHEIMIGTPAIRNLIREAKVPQMYSAIQTGVKDGMQTLDQSLKELVDQGLVSSDDALNKATNKSLFE